jgi:hypothetical protein
VNQDFPIRYVDPVFRPQSEAQSLILPVTNGCSWNKCTYCEIYKAPQKKFAWRVLDSLIGLVMLSLTDPNDNRIEKTQAVAGRNRFFIWGK